MGAYPGLFPFVGACLLAWLAGYCIGLVWRTTRQIFEKATRGG